ncbi:MAG: hypothetical protein RIG62_18270 [Cyclobacteriaceae bacterium]
MKTLTLLGLLLVSLLMACQPDELDITPITDFDSGLSAPTETLTFPDTLLFINRSTQPLTISWLPEVGTGYWLTGQEQGLATFQVVPTVPLRYVPDQAGLHQGKLIALNALGQLDTIAYATDLAKVYPEFNARLQIDDTLQTGSIYVKQQSESIDPTVVYTVVATSETDQEILFQYAGIEGVYRLGDQVPISYELFLQNELTLPFRWSYLSLPYERTQVEFTVSDASSRKITHSKEFSDVEELPVPELEFNARVIAVDSANYPFLLYARQQQATDTNEEYTLTITSDDQDLELTYSVAEDSLSYYLGDQVVVSYQQFVARDQLLPVYIEPLVAEAGQDYPLTFTLQDKGGTEIEIEKIWTFAPK